MYHRFSFAFITGCGGGCPPYTPDYTALGISSTHDCMSSTVAPGTPCEIQCANPASSTAVGTPVVCVGGSSGTGSGTYQGQIACVTNASAGCMGGVGAGCSALPGCNITAIVGSGCGSSVAPGAECMFTTSAVPTPGHFSQGNLRATASGGWEAINGASCPACESTTGVACTFEMCFVLLVKALLALHVRLKM